METRRRTFLRRPYMILRGMRIGSVGQVCLIIGLWLQIAYAVWIVVHMVTEP
jgi:hypothetical protein